MEFKQRTLMQIADMICGNFKEEESVFRYRNSSYLTEFFSDCDTEYVHDGSTRNYWVTGTLKEILAGRQPGANIPPDAAAVDRLSGSGGLRGADARDRGGADHRRRSYCAAICCAAGRDAGIRTGGRR
jgi:hypothetical protein